MSVKLVVTGTDTAIGKTVFSAGLTDYLAGSYWKPVQSGLDAETDTEIVARLARLPRSRVVTERWRLNTPASPHYAAHIDGVSIHADDFALPDADGPLVIEGAGGLMVPLNRTTRYIDIFARWKLPTVLCARTALGTINHSLLSIEAMRSRDIPILGVAFVGDASPDSERIICEMGGVRRLGRLPRLDPLTHETLHAAFAESFTRSDFLTS